jgi:hypothetical protein
VYAPAMRRGEDETPALRLVGEDDALAIDGELVV